MSALGQKQTLFFWQPGLAQAVEKTIADFVNPVQALAFLYT